MYECSSPFVVFKHFARQAIWAILITWWDLVVDVVGKDHQVTRSLYNETNSLATRDLERIDRMNLDWTKVSNQVSTDRANVAWCLQRRHLLLCVPPSRDVNLRWRIGMWIQPRKPFEVLHTFRCHHSKITEVYCHITSVHSIARVPSFNFYVKKLRSTISPWMGWGYYLQSKQSCATWYFKDTKKTLLPP